MKRLALALSLLALPAAAHEVTTETLVIDHPYALETPATAMSGAGYMTITNTGNAPDRLLEVRADFPRVTLHGTETDAQGVTRMIPVEGIEIAPGETVTLAPGGMHVMFMGLDGDPFEEGERIPATLVFERAGEIAVEFWVEPRDGGMTGHEGHDHGSIAPGDDPVMLAEAQAALRNVLGADTIIGPAAFAGALQRPFGSSVCHRALQRSSKRQSPQSKPISLQRNALRMAHSLARCFLSMDDGSFRQA